MLYRPYKLGDFEEICAIEKECFRPPLRFSRRYIRALVARTEGFSWVAAPVEAENPRRLAGFALAGFERIIAQGRRQRIAYLETIEVRAEHRLQGVAGELLRRVEASARAGGAALVWLHVAEENAAARRLYESHGFQPQGRKESYYGKGQNALVYLLRLERSAIAGVSVAFGDRGHGDFATADPLHRTVEVHRDAPKPGDRQREHNRLG